MRSDLTAGFIAAKNQHHRKPIQLLKFYFAAGTVSVSDRRVEIRDPYPPYPMSALFLPLVEEWGSLETAGDSSQDTGEIRQMSVTMWNGGKTPFSDHFLIENPENVEVELYQWFDGLMTPDPWGRMRPDIVLIDRFVIQDPIEYGEASRLLTLDLVSLGMRYDGPVGDLLTRAAWPHALEADINKGIPLIVGSPGQVPTLCGRTAPAATMSGSILLKPTVINVHEDLDELGFPAAGKLQIDEEIMYYSSRTATSFAVRFRANDGTNAAEHSDGAQIIQRIYGYSYIVGTQVAAIDDVRVGGSPAKAGTYVVYPHHVPAAVIVFYRHPTFIQYSKGARETDLDFDATTGANTAYQPHYAYAADQKTNGAALDKNHRELAIRQTDPAADDGQVVRAFLSVEHWATDTYANDYVDVWVDGIGVVGTLAKPNKDDIAGFTADVDIDHGHDHRTGPGHTHYNNDPDFGSSADAHLHNLDGSEASVDGDTDNSLRSYGGANGYWGTINIPYGPYKAGMTRAMVKFKMGYVTGANSYAQIGSTKGTARYQECTAWITDPRYIRVYVRALKGHWDNSAVVEFKITEVKIYFGAATTDRAALSVRTSKTTSGAVTGMKEAITRIKDPNDVVPIATTNRALQNIITSSSSRSVTQRFDLTKHLASITWDWFHNREIRLRYTGSVNSVQVVVTYVKFVVEYRQRETVFSDDVTCSPTGSLGNRPDHIIQYLLNIRAGLPLGHLALALAGIRFTALGYQLDGLFSASMTVRQAIKKICFQTRSRLIWEGGKAKLVIREKIEQWNSVKSLLPEDMQQKAIRVHRQPVADIVNDINLFYNKDHTSGSDDKTAFLLTAQGSDQTSINKHGIRRKDDTFLFDLVKNVAMAENLADFYLWLLGEPSTFYEFTFYLPQFDLEKEDVITVTSQGFSRIVRLPMVVRAADRQFGSAKNKSINLYRVLAESIRHRLIEVRTEDIINLADTLSIEMDDEINASDPVGMADLLISIITTAAADNIGVSDELLTIFDVVQTETDTATMSDVLISIQTVTVSDGAALEDKLICDSGFGSPLGDGFGVVPFGS